MLVRVPITLRPSSPITPPVDDHAERPSITHHTREGDYPFRPSSRSSTSNLLTEEVQANDIPSDPTPESESDEVSVPVVGRLVSGDVTVELGSIEPGKFAKNDVVTRKVSKSIHHGYTCILMRKCD